MADDLVDTAKYVSSLGFIGQTILISDNLTARVALKAVINQPKLADLMVYINPVIDVNNRIKSLYSEEDIQLILNEPSRICDVFGMPINAKSFFKDALENQFFYLEETISDVKRQQSDFLVYFDRHNQDPMKIIGGLNTKGRIFYTSSDSEEKHGTKDDSTQGTVTAQHLLTQIRGELGMDDIAAIFPDKRTVETQSYIERQKLHHYSYINKKTSDSDFWNSYLNEFHFVLKIPEFRNYYNDITHEMRHINNFDKILDAGCGNGGFGSWLLSMVKYESLDIHLSYMGIDFLVSAIEKAKNNHDLILKQLLSNKPQVTGSFLYQKVDLNRQLPYLAETFDHIFCNLVIPYLKNPGLTIKELFRVLKTGRKLIFTTLVPNPNFVQIFLNFSRSRPSSDDLLQAKKLLDNTSHLLQKERNGEFHFFSREDLESLILPITKSYKITTSLAGQVNIICIEKSA